VQRGQSTKRICLLLSKMGLLGLENQCLVE
jgi:hypothetical protein